MDYRHMKFEDIVNWCVENNETAWLKQLVNTPVKATKEDGTEYERDINFLEVRKAFCAKFMPDLIPVAKPKKPTMKDIVGNL